MSVISAYPEKAYILADTGTKEPAHIMTRMLERNITDDEVKKYVDNARFAILQFNGTRKLYITPE